MDSFRSKSMLAYLVSRDGLLNWIVMSEGLDEFILSLESRGRIAKENCLIMQAILMEWGSVFLGAPLERCSIQFGQPLVLQTSP